MGQRRDELQVWLIQADEALSEYVDYTYRQSAEYLTGDMLNHVSRPWE